MRLVACWILGLAMMVTCGVCEAARWTGPTLPDQIDGWKSAAAMKLVDKSNIFDYMDGAGELYLAYSFKSMAVRDYSRPSQPKITAEVYDMGNSADAFGVYSHERGDGGPAGIGQDCDYGYGLLRFWKGSWFVRVISEKETPEAKAAVLSIGRLISKEISPSGKRPVILSLLPNAGLMPSSVHYFHKQAVLNYHFYLADENILDLGDKTEAVLAQYKIGSTKPRLLVIEYPSAEAAAAAYEHFCRIYFKDKPASHLSKRIEAVEDGEFAGVARNSKALRLVFEAKSSDVVERLLIASR